MKANRRCSILFHLLVPGGRWQTADGDRYPEFVGQDLQFSLPQAETHPVAAAAIRGDQQPRRGGIADCAELTPPAPDALGGEDRCVVTDAEKHRRASRTGDPGANARRLG